MISTRARACVNHGRWLAHCPNGCNNAEELHPWGAYKCGHGSCSTPPYPEPMFHCSNCHTLASIDWPTDAADLWAALLERPDERNRNWYPLGHDLAESWGLPTGQSVDDLRVEHRAMAG